MQTDALKQKIIAAKTSLGIDKIGFTTAAPFRHLAAGLKTQKAKGYISGFEHQVLAQRLYPQRIFDHPQSIIAIALAYPSKLPFKVPHDRQQPRGRFARASWGLDYHQILRDKMQQLINFIKANIDVKAHFKAMVDTGELIDQHPTSRTRSQSLAKYILSKFRIPCLRFLEKQIPYLSSFGYPLSYVNKLYTAGTTQITAAANATSPKTRPTL